MLLIVSMLDEMCELLEGIVAIVLKRRGSNSLTVYPVSSDEKGTTGGRNFLAPSPRSGKLRRPRALTWPRGQLLGPR